MDAKRTVLVATPIVLAAAASLVALWGRPAIDAGRFPVAHGAVTGCPDAPGAEDLGLLRHRLNVSEQRRKDETAALRARLASAEAKLRARAPGLDRRADEQVQRAAREAGFVAVPELAQENGFPIDRGLATVQELVAALEGMMGNAALFEQDVLDHVHDRLAAEISANPAALQWLVGKFRSSIGSELAGMLAFPLGQVKDPVVESAALDLVRSRDSERHRLAGLELPQRLEIPGGETRHAVLGVLHGYGSPEVLSSALYALQRGVPDPEETRAALAAVAPLTLHADPEVRRRAVIAAADWAPDAAALEPVVRALGDPSPDVRAGAAYALSRSRVASPDGLRALVARVEDEQEDWAVREQAWRALGRCPLDDRMHAAYVAFASQVEALGEAGGSDGSEPDES